MKDLLCNLAQVYDRAKENVCEIEKKVDLMKNLKEVRLFENGTYLKKDLDEKEIANSIIWDNNILSMEYLRRMGYENKFQFIYLDPPFFSQKDYFSRIDIKNYGHINYKTFCDSKIKNIEDYLETLVGTVLFSQKLLATSGTVAIHLDWHASHYVKILMDEIFGYNNFVNEIIWQYKSGGSRNKGFARKHDSILIYSKSDDYKFNKIKEKSYNRGFKPYKFKGIKEYQDEKGWYTLVNPKDVWEIDMVGRTSGERTGYATQKPRKLLNKLIRAFSDKEDLIGDFFMGSGTTFMEALELARKVIGCDNSGFSIKTVVNRFEKQKNEEISLVLAEEMIKGILIYKFDREKGNERDNIKITFTRETFPDIEKHFSQMSKKDGEKVKHLLKYNKNTGKAHYEEIVESIYISSKDDKGYSHNRIIKSKKELENYFNEKLNLYGGNLDVNKEKILIIDIFGNFYEVVLRESK